MKALRATTRIGFVTLLAAGLALILATTLASRGAGDDKGILANLLSRVLSTPTARVSIGSVEGALSSDATINGITIADRDGVWLEVDKVRLNWRRTALLLGRLEVDKLEIGTVKILRRPLPAEESLPASDEPILPEVPLKIEVKDFSLGKLTLGEPVVGVAASVSASGNASLGKPSEGLNLRFDARRLDAAGTLMARLALVPQTERLDVKLGVDEPAGGILAHAMNVPGLPPIKFDLNGSGTLDAFNARLAFNAGDGADANGTAQLRRENQARRLTLDLAARIEGLLPAVAAPVFAGTTRVNGNIVFADNSAITISPLSVVSQTARLDIQGGLSADQVADLKISARAVPNAGQKTAVHGTEIGKLAFDATVAGPIVGPKVEATLDAQNVVAPQGKVARVSGKFTVSPSGGVLDETTSIPFSASAQASGLALSDPAMARAVGTSLSLALAGRMHDGIADLDTARLQTAASDARFNGRVGGKVLEGRVTANVPDLARFGGLAALDLHGALGLTADLTGVPNDGRFEAALDGHATHFGTGLAAVDGVLGGRLDIDGKVSKLPHGGYGFGNLRIAGIGVSARIDGQATPAQANIDAHVSIPDLKRADHRLSGRAEVAAQLTGTVNRPDAKASITVTDARALGRPVPRLALEAVATDVTGLLDAHVALSGTVDRKPAQGALQIAKQPNGGWRLDGLDLRVGSVTMQGGLTLNNNRLADGRLRIDAGDLDDLSPLVLTRLSGRLHADATLAVADGRQNASLSAQAHSVKIGQTTLERLTAQARVTDAYRPAPAGDWRLRVDKLVLAQARDAGLPPLNIDASGRLANGRSSVNATVAAGSAGTIRVSGAVPLQGDGLDLRAKGQVNLGVANQSLSEAGRHVTGRADVDVRAAGSLTHPTVNGTATLAGASYRDAVLGIRYTDISGRISAHGTEIKVERLTAQTPNGGKIAAQGNVEIDPSSGFPGNIEISSRRAKLIENDIVSAVANLSLTLSGPLARSPKISGKVDVVSLDVTIPERLPTTLSPIEGTVHVSPPPAAAARIAAGARARAQGGRAPPFAATLNLTISAPNRVFVRGRGIDAELGGNLQVRGKLSDPETVGAFELRRGRMSVAGTRLDFTKGNIAFTGSLTPTLDFVAQTHAGDVTAIIAVAGPARQPSFTFSSEPQLPQDEVLSRILFAKASGGLSATQALQLAQVAAQFSGAGGTGVFERVRRSLGVDSLDVSVGANGNPTVGISRAINRRISIGVKTGTEPTDSGASVDIDVTRNLRLKGEATASGATAVGVGMEWEY